MNKSDYDKYYKKGGTYVIPVEIFNELFDELEEFKEEHEIMKQILIENNLWETLLNDDRFLEYLRK